MSDLIADLRQNIILNMGFKKINLKKTTWTWIGKGLEENHTAFFKDFFLTVAF
jgi:hypothetical protein